MVKRKRTFKGEGVLKCKMGGFFLNLFILREREHKQGRGREREGERESQAGSTLTEQSPVQGLIS